VSDDQGPIHSHYLGHGGAAGVLGTPVGAEREGAGHGSIRDFRGAAYGAEHGISLRTPAEKSSTSCHRPDESGTPVESTVAWSPETGAQAVHGEIRAVWLKLGAESGDLGYPTSDELPTPDGRGRRSEFQFGEIWWHPDTGAAVRRPDLDPSSG